MRKSSARIRRPAFLQGKALGMFKLVIGLFLISGSSPIFAQSTEDRSAVLEPIARWDQAWQTRDPDLASRDYADDAHWVNAFGHRASGREQIEAILTEVFSLPFVVAGESRTVGHDVRFLGSDVAVVATTIERLGQLAPDGQPLGARHTSHLRVLHRQGANWRIVSHLISDARDRTTPSH